jgi:hypothetical protein
MRAISNTTLSETCLQLLILSSDDHENDDFKARKFPPTTFIQNHNAMPCKTKQAQNGSTSLPIMVKQ